MKPENISKETRTFFVLMAFLSLILISGCGGSSLDSLNPNLDTDVQVLNPINLSNQDNGTFSGKVVVKFKDGTEVRLFQGNKEEPFSSPYKAVSTQINSIILDPSLKITSISRVLNISEEEFEEMRNRWSSQDVELHDWNLAYYIGVPNEEEAKKVVDALKTNSDVEYVEILPSYYLTAVITTPDLSGEQGYLESASQGGLGVKDAWNKLDAKFSSSGTKVRGQNTTIVDQELDWNFDHEMLPVDETAEYVLGYGSWLTFSTESGKNVPNNINHGTAVLGIIAGQGNGAGIVGIVPETKLWTSSVAGGPIGGDGVAYADDTTVGAIATIEVQQRGVTNVSSGCTVGDGTSSSNVTGCVPLESSLFNYNQIKDSISTGMIIVEGAGNGGVDLNVDTNAAPVVGTYSYFTRSENDSGSIVVGASLGSDKRKASWSNCGDRVDVFAWGQGVVTSGYGDKENPDGADPNILGASGADNPRLYTAQFGGTSAATAQIAGVAALVQSYARQLVEEDGYVGKTVYLDSKQIRQILKESGQSAVYGQTENDPNPNCNIGVQPDASVAIDRTDSLLNSGAILKIVPKNQYVVTGIRYDMDGDGKADLISFSRDHKWYVDLSGDTFGSWNLVLTPPVFESNAMLFPVVADYNSDGRADLAVYDSANGLWYIKYTNTKMLNGEAFGEWNRVIDYSGVDGWKAYSRPLVADFNRDKFVDISFATPDGNWIVDFGGFTGIQLINGNVEYLDKFSPYKINPDDEIFEKSIPYLSTAQASASPDWAWLPNLSRGQGDIEFSAPDGVDVIKNLSYIAGSVWSAFKEYNIPYVAGGDRYYFTYSIANLGGVDKIGVKNNIDGSISLYTTTGTLIESFSDFGDLLCRPVPADYDGDGEDDMAVQCSDAWKIIYSTDASGTMISYPLQALDPLPGNVYFSGIKYQDVSAIFNYYKLQLPCNDGQICASSSTIDDVQPPVGPYFAECINYWAANPAYCWKQ